MLNWIVWNGTVVDIETELFNWELFWHLTVLTKSVLILNWISSVLINWIDLNRNIFDNGIVYSC